MPFPKTNTDLAAQGYVFDNSAHCRGCGAEIDWYRTPKGKKIPLDPGTLEAHWSSCPKAKDFRK